MRGTFSANEMVAKERSPSVNSLLDIIQHVELIETYTWLQRFGFPNRIDWKNPQQNN